MSEEEIYVQFKKRIFVAELIIESCDYFYYSCQWRGFIGITKQDKQKFIESELYIYLPEKMQNEIKKMLRNNHNEE